METYTAVLLAAAAAVTAVPVVEERQQQLPFDHIVVGSGAGGGPLANRLACANNRVLLIESGDDQGTNYKYTVPGFQAAVTEDKQVAWDIYVNHYENQTWARRDPKYLKGKGRLYPRAGTLGGCLSHNALIWITPHASDWDNIASIKEMPPGHCQICSSIWIECMNGSQQRGGTRDSVRDRIVDTVNQRYPLTVRTNYHLTKINFDTSGSAPKAIGVDFLDGQNLYRASPLSSASGTSGSARAKKEVIMACGSYHSIQMLNLSGIGPAQELQQTGIQVVQESPGLGSNMQDRYEIPVNSVHPYYIVILDGCTFDAKPQDSCYETCQSNPSVLALRGAYGSNGLAFAITVNSEYAENSDIDLFIFGGLSTSQATS